MAPIIESFKTCALGRQRPFSPSVPAVAAGRQFELLPMHLIQGRAYTVSWLVQIRLFHPCFQPASPHPTPLHKDETINPYEKVLP